MITARAVLANPKGELIPGLFAKVRVVLGANAHETKTGKELKQQYDDDEDDN